MTIVLLRIFLQIEKRVEHLFSLSLVPQELSLNIDINRILPVKFSGVSSNFNSKHLTSSLSCNVLNPGKINSIGSPSILSKFRYFEEDFNHPNLCSHASFDWEVFENLPKAQHRIRKDVDRRALKIDNSFVTNQ